jgi:hypothetical protein
VPGRKTDVQDCVWIAQLLEHGLLRGSFVPPAPIRDLRDLTRHRRALQQERTRTANRLHKLLQDAGIKLASVASNILGASGRAMLAALVEGTTDPKTLADLAKGKLRRKLPALRDALVGRFRDHHAFLASQLLAHLDDLDEAITMVSERIAEALTPYSEELARLDTIPGVGRHTGEILIAEIGVDMTQFPSDRHLASWAGLCPGKALASTDPSRRAKGTTGFGRRSSRPRWRRSAPGIPRSALAIDGSCGTEAIRRRSWLSPTPCCARRTMSSRPAARITNRALTTSTGGTQPALRGVPSRPLSVRATE